MRCPLVFVYEWYGDHRDLHSFPTRRSSDLAKTSHGLIRGSSRYQIIGVIDEASAGRDAGEVLDGTPRNIPVFATLDRKSTRLNSSHANISYAVFCLKNNELERHQLLEHLRA